MKLYRLFEFLPAALAWGTLAGVVLASWKLPTAAAVFIILFDIYWLFKTVYLSLHLRATFRRMRRNMKINWLQKLQDLPPTTYHLQANWRDVYHLVILPMAMEPYAVVRESLESLVGVNYQKDRLIVVLAREARIPGSADTAARLAEEFGDNFSSFLATAHPHGSAGEIPGKGSNETWAAKAAKEEIIDRLKLPYENILVSVFDADTQVGKEYFGVLTHAFLTAPHPQRSSYQPIPLFTNNIFQAPALARVIAFSSSFWHMVQQSRPERLTTFSSHSMPFAALVEVGFWNTNVVSEDSQIFWQCFLRYDGDWRVVPILYPVSMDANVAPRFWQTMRNLYKQQRRWGWGCENIPYFLAGFAKHPRIPLGKKLYWGFHYIEGFHSWATNALVIFSLGWLPILLGDAQFNLTVLSYNLPRITRWVMSFAMIGIASSAVLGVILLPPKPSWFRWHHYFLYVIQWVLMPVHLIVFGSFPALDSQTRLALGGKFRLGFWITPKFREKPYKEPIEVSLQ